MNNYNDGNDSSDPTWILNENGQTELAVLHEYGRGLHVAECEDGRALLPYAYTELTEIQAKRVQEAEQRAADQLADALKLQPEDSTAYRLPGGGLIRSVTSILTNPRPRPIE